MAGCRSPKPCGQGSNPWCFAINNMLRILQLIFLGHYHVWETIGENKYELRKLDGSAYSTGTRFILKCKHCGKVKKVDLI